MDELLTKRMAPNSSVPMAKAQVTLSFEESEKRGFFGREKMVQRAEIIGSDLHERLTADPRFRVSLFRSVPLGKLKASVWRVCRVGDRACP